jgi:hypothetical protein
MKTRPTDPGSPRASFTGHRALIGGALLASVLAFSVAIAAGSGLKTRTATTTVGPTPDASSKSARCPRGNTVISGGFDNPGFKDLEPGHPGLFAYASHKSRVRKWTVGAQNDNNGAGTETVFAYCRTAKPLETRSARTTVPNTGAQHGTATAMCPSGLKAISGGFDNPGFSTDGGAGFFPYVSKKFGRRGWRVSVELYRPAPATLKAFVYCRAGGGVKTRSADATVPGTGSQTAMMTARCKRGEALVSGGYSTTSKEFAGGVTGPDLWYYSSHEAGPRGWTVSAFDNGGASGGTFKALAYCQNT